MRNYMMLLALAAVTSACSGAGSSIPTGPSSGPSATRGVIDVRTTTNGNVPNQDGYLLVVDDTTPFIGLRWTGTATLAPPIGHHTLRLRRVPPNCSVVPDTVVDVVVALGDTIAVDFATTCPPVPRGYARITLLTTGSPSTPGPYDVWYEHYDAYNGNGDYGKLGELSPGGARVVYLPASTDTGDDPYFYQFWISPVPSNCGGDTYTSQYHITAQDTVDVAVTLACTP
jgi:hypothetical protein